MERNPVLLVHGLYDTVAKFEVLSAYLDQLGWSVHSINLKPNDGSAPLNDLAKQVADYVDQTFESGQIIDLLGFSMGGLVTRYYLQRLGGVERVKRYITISAPNNGTLTAYSLSLKGVTQMRMNSPFLQDLNQDHDQYLSQLQVTNLWTPYDLMILPAHSSKMGIGREISVPVAVHAWMPSDRRVMELIASALSDSLESV
ncbi:MAG: alpha/beta fold hydrolase [Microcystaceae cyanobacterium]